MHALLHSVPPALQQATADPHHNQRLLDTHGQVWVSLLSGHCSFLLGPGAQQGSVCACQEFVSQSCVSSGCSMVGSMAASPKRAYAIPRSASPRAPSLKSLLMKVKEENEKVGLKLNIQTKIMATGPITSWQIEGETMQTVADFILGGSKVTEDGDCSHEIGRCLLLGRKAMINLDSMLKSRDITLPTKSILSKLQFLQ